MTVRRMTVVRCPGTMDRPMIKIANSTLEDVGFEMGTAIEVLYQRDEIVIRKLKDYHEPNNVQKEPAGPVPNTVSTGATAEAEAGRVSDQRASATALRDIQSLSYVLGGHGRPCHA